MTIKRPTIAPPMSEHKCDMEWQCKLVKCKPHYCQWCGEELKEKEKEKKEMG